MIEAPTATLKVTPEQLGALGMEQVAYLRPVTLEGGEAAIGVFAADGRPLAAAASMALAQALVRQNDMEPAYVQ